jgi:hypothetical protein
VSGPVNSAMTGVLACQIGRTLPFRHIISKSHFALRRERGIGNRHCQSTNREFAFGPAEHEFIGGLTCNYARPRRTEKIERSSLDIRNAHKLPWVRQHRWQGCSFAMENNHVLLLRL